MTLSQLGSQGLDSSNCCDLKQGDPRWDPVPTPLPTKKLWSPSRENTLRGVSRGLWTKLASKDLGREQR